MASLAPKGPQEEVVEPEWQHLPDRVAKAFEGKTVFITGGTGLVGKVLVDKILRCCRGVKKMFLLVRAKKGKSGMERIDSLFESPLFDLLKSDKSNDFRAKVFPISGDVSLKDLGISHEDRKLLAEEVNIVYHSAASVRFDDPFKKIVIMNVRGCKYMLELANEIKNLQLYFHVSTAYAHTREKVLEEKMYDPPANPHDVLKLIELLSEEVLDTIAPKLMEGYPNSYGFTKGLGEALVNEEIRKGKLPVVIIRPSVVIPLYRYPLPGWSDNMNGPAGLLIAAGKGVLRTMYMPKTTYADFAPVDLVGNALCVITYAYLSYPENRKTWSVINITTSSVVKFTWKEIIELGRHLVVTKVPFNWVPWYPGGGVTTCYYHHTINFYLKQILPAIIGDAILSCLRIEPVLMKIQRRISKGYEVFHYYTSNQWNFVNKNLLAMRDDVLNEREAAVYMLDDENLDIEKYFLNCMIGARRYLMHEPDETLPTAMRHMKVMYAVDKLFQILLYYLAFCFLYKIYQSIF
ncbi:putative fatty acyl-CoA reductase CG5065 [Atheta coriaria]|uniref:putative fatty acyl-CoA reductase CG5065 n=1 Tax=Dalotia coriaria TaxID=877792 RepID=UPI0031F4691D